VQREEGAVAERSVYRAACPTRQVLDRVADRWTTLVLGVLARGPHRYGQIARATEGVSPRVLSRTLRDLERDGLVERTLLTVTPPAVEYALTPLGATLDAVIRPLRDWAEANVDAIHAARDAFDGDTTTDRTPWQHRKPLPSR
jgi:DNA-binding HxlR family transcriptional regulator